MLDNLHHFQKAQAAPPTIQGVINVPTRCDSCGSRHAIKCIACTSGIGYENVYVPFCQPLPTARPRCDGTAAAIGYGWKAVVRRFRGNVNQSAKKMNEYERWRSGYARKRESDPAEPSGLAKTTV